MQAGTDRVEFLRVVFDAAGAILGESASSRSAFDQRGSRPRREGLPLSIRKYRAWRGNANSAREKIVRSLNDSQKNMKNEHQENGPLRGPLILLVPVSNFCGGHESRLARRYQSGS
jgi:hypothetical protein